MLNKLKIWFFYNIRLRIGRPERCFMCGRIIWNRNEGLHFSLYEESQNPNHKRSIKLKRTIRHLDCDKK